MNDYCLFADASVNPVRKVGVGGYLIVPERFIRNSSELIKILKMEEHLVLKRVSGTSSTKLELQAVLWALGEYCKGPAISGAGKLHIYSDSQCVEGLLQRRVRLERGGFQSGRGDSLLKNASLYREYYEFYDHLGFDVTKVPGHTRYCSRDTVRHIFAFIDKKVRKALKLWIARLEAERAEWYVYIIRCHDGALYTGISNDVTRRFEKHRETGKKGAKYLRGRGPLQLVFQKKIGSKSSALKMEQKIKKLSKSQKESIIQNGDIVGNLQEYLFSGRELRLK